MAKDKAAQAEKKSGGIKSFMDWVYEEPEPEGTPTDPNRQYPVRLLKRHSLKTRITHDIVALSCLWLMFSGAFVFFTPLAHAFPNATQFFRMSHRIIGAIFILVPLLSAITSPKGFVKFVKQYAVKWTKEDWDFLKKFVFYMLNCRKVHMPDQDEVKSGQRFADLMLVFSCVFIAISGVVLWLGTSVFNAGATALLVMRTIHDICFLLLIVFGLAHIYLGAGIFEPYKGTARLMFGDGKVPESDAIYHWGFWAREEIEAGKAEVVKEKA